VVQKVNDTLDRIKHARYVKRKKRVRTGRIKPVSHGEGGAKCPQGLWPCRRRLKRIRKADGVVADAGAVGYDHPHLLPRRLPRLPRQP
jgi:hypothetical protein